MPREIGTWIASVALHVSAFAVAFYGLPGFERDLPEAPPMIQVEFVQIAEKATVKAPEPKKEEPKEQAAPQKRQVYAKAEATPPPAADAMPEMSEPKPTIKAPDPKPSEAEIHRAKLRSTVRPNMKPKPPSRLKVSKLAALIDKSIEEDEPDTPVAEAESEEKPSDSQPSKLTGLAADLARGTVINALNKAMSECWLTQGGIKDIANMKVKIRLRMSTSGHYVQQPSIVQELYEDNGFYRVFKEDALRAAIRCEPAGNPWLKRELKLDHYEIWDDVTYTFDGARLVGN